MTTSMDEEVCNVPVQSVLAVQVGTAQCMDWRGLTQRVLELDAVRPGVCGEVVALKPVTCDVVFSDVRHLSQTAHSWGGGERIMRMSLGYLKRS